MNAPPRDENDGMRQSTFFRRYGLLICIAAFVCLPVVFFDAKAALESMKNDASDWLPEDFPQTDTVHWFAERFGGDAMLVVSWPGCGLNDERLDRMREGLLQAEGSVDGGPAERFFRQVFSGRDTLAELTAPPIGLSRETAVARMRGWLVGPGGTDDPTTCAVAFLSNAGWINRESAVEAVYDIAGSIGLDADELRLGGPAVDSVAIDTVGRESLIPLLGAAIICAIAIAWWCLRNVRFVLSVFFYAMFAWGISLAIVHCCGINMDAVLITMPALVYVLALSAAVHMTGYYKKAVGEVGILEAPSRAVRVGWAPCTAAAVTTAFGVGSLMISEIVPVRRFGIFAAVGVAAALALLLTLWPSSIQCLISGRRRRRRGGADEEAAASRSNPPRRQRRTTWWLPLFHFATTRWNVILLLFAVCLPVLGYGVSRIRTSVSLRDLLSARSKIIRNYEWLESNIGPLIPVDVILRFPEPDPEDPYALLQRIRLVERTRKCVHQMPAVGGTLAASTFLPQIPTGRRPRHTAWSGVLAPRIHKNRQRLVDIHYLYDEYGESDGQRPREELWRISGRVKALGDLDYASFLDQLQREVNDSLLRDDTAGSLGVTAKVTGGVFLVAMAQDQLLVDLRNSFLIAFLLIAVAMMVLTRSVSAGLLSMIPNAFPALLIFGLMGWLDVAVDVGTMMTASVALGIAVDDTSHFLTWFRRGLAKGLPKIEAIRYAYAQCATAMLETSVICGFGILPFALSPFMPVARFAILMFVLLFAAIAGNLLLLAAALASPAGRFPGVKRKGREHGDGGMASSASMYCPSQPPVDEVGPTFSTGSRTMTYESVPPSKPVHIAVIGCGRWGPNHVRCLGRIPGCTVTAVDRDPARLDAIRSDFPSVRAKDDPLDVLDDDEIDAVIIATPTATHFQLCRQAIQAGKHVLCEKPLCTTAREANELLELAEAGNRTLMTGHISLFNPGIRKIKELSDAGELGTIQYLSAVRTNLGPICTDGNAAFDLAAHDVSVFNWILGAVPISVNAAGGAFVQSNIHDVVFANLNYPRGQVASIHASWLNPKKVRQITVVGSQRTATWDDLRLGTPVAIYDRGANLDKDSTDFRERLRVSMWNGDVRLPKIDPVEPLGLQAQYFHDAIRSGHLELSDGRFALGVVKVLEAIGASLRQGGAPVAIE